jgi:hypothetical protein
MNEMDGRHVGSVKYAVAEREFGDAKGSTAKRLGSTARVIPVWK